jgi:MFS family permease
LVVAGASLLVGRALTAVHWGIAADKYGRKPIMVLSLISVIVFHTLFGLIKNFWVALATRFLLGGFNGMHGAVKANLDLSSYVVEGKKWISFSQNFVSSALSCGTVLQQTKKNLFQCMQK